ncbi:uncharacterized protein RJT20DRAFT_132988 [Scheffersomyces xylosifermentans]|uniref:uncharacterized protein n=1 Tax=Scheffersomyces xylosifermentans TaxID=1304137 RepID=UPI00315CF344
MGILSFFTVLTSTVYPVIASYKAFEEYTRAVSVVDASNFKVGGITVPFSLLVKREGVNTDAANEAALQIHLITIQKWFIYWVVLATAQLVESVLFLKYLVPLYTVFKLAFSVWLIVPMVTSFNAQADTSKTFDTTKDWVAFTRSGPGLLYFSYIQPWIEGNFDTLINLPLSIPSLFGIASKLGSAAMFREKDNSHIDLTGTNSADDSADYANMLDSSYVMVMNIKNRFGYGGKEEDRDISAESSSTGTDDIVKNVTSDLNQKKVSGTEKSVPDPSPTTSEKKKGWLW